MTRWLLATVVVSACWAAPASAQFTPRNADFVSYFELGQSPAGGASWLNPAQAITDNDNGAGVSLGGWTDENINVPTSLTGGFNVNQANPVGLVVGFTDPVPNRPGGTMDLIIFGNPLTDPISGDETWYEPGFIEVARETGGGAATPNGWADETFYLIRPGNYALLPNDPRDGPIPIAYDDSQVGGNGENSAAAYTDPAWRFDGPTRDLYGYADVHAEGDKVDIDDAIDDNGDPVQLSDISYVRIRTVSNTNTNTFGRFSTEVTNVQDYPEPSSIFALGLGGLALVVRRRRQR